MGAASQKRVEGLRWVFRWLCSLILVWQHSKAEFFMQSGLSHSQHTREWCPHLRNTFSISMLQIGRKSQSCTFSPTLPLTQEASLVGLVAPEECSVR